jgi:hypothetical protein
VTRPGGRPPADRPDRPALRVISGDASAEEIAALLAVIGSRAQGGRRAPEPAPSGWNDHGRGLRGPLAHGPGRWTASAHPR